MNLENVKFFTVSANTLSEAFTMAQAIVPAFSFIFDVTIAQDVHQKLWFITIYGKEVE